MSDDPADIRAVLREHGYEPPARGKLSADWLDKYASIQAGTDGSQVPGDDDPADVTAASYPDPGPLAAGEAMPAENRPRKTAAGRKPLSDRLKAARGGTRGRKRKVKHPRVPVDRLTGVVWEALGRLFTPISPPTGRCLQLEAPVAGLILEDIVRDTAADRILQPLARAEEKGKKILALAGPPMIVLALEQAQQLDDAQRMAREAFLIPMLREALVLWGDVAGDKLEEQMARAAERGPSYERADELMALIFAPPTAGPATSPPAPEDEDDAAAEAQHMAGV